MANSGESKEERMGGIILTVIIIIVIIILTSPLWLFASCVYEEHKDTVAYESGKSDKKTMHMEFLEGCSKCE